MERRLDFSIMVIDGDNIGKMVDSSTGFGPMLAPASLTFTLPFGILNGCLKIDKLHPTDSPK